MKKSNLRICVLSLLVLQACSDESTVFSGKQGGTEVPQGSDAVSGVDSSSGGEAGMPSEGGAPIAEVDETETTLPGGTDSPGDVSSDTEETIIEGVKNEGSTTEFGSAAVFRVGDGAAEASSCKTDVVSYDVSGAEYSFLFRVEEDDTTLSFFVNRLCGIDIAGTNLISLVNLGKDETVASQSLPQNVYSPGEGSLEPFSQAIVLAKGQYAIRVVSHPNMENNGDRDDFLIGNIKVVANKLVVGTGIETK